MRRSPDSSDGSRGFSPRNSFFTILLATLSLPFLPPKAAAGGETKFLTGDLPGAIVVRERAYEGKALYGYIDGGAELYIEYGFRRAVVQEIALETLHVHLEVFEMTSRETAAGIFSVTSRGCFPDSDFYGFTCASRFHAQKARGRYYVRGANVSGTPAESSLTAAAVSVVASKIEDSAFSAPALFRDSLFLTGQRSFLLAQGPLGLENGLDEWRDIAEGAGRFRLKVLSQEFDRVEAKVALLEFETEDGNPFDPVRWKESAPPGTRRFVVVDTPRRMFLCEINGDQSTAEQYRSTLERYRYR